MKDNTFAFDEQSAQIESFDSHELTVSYSSTTMALTFVTRFQKYCSFYLIVAHYMFVNSRFHQSIRLNDYYFIIIYFLYLLDKYNMAKANFSQ